MSVRRFRYAVSAAGLLALSIAAPAQAEAPPLTAAALQACAAQVQQLRSEATRLTQWSAQLETRRSALDQRSVALQAEAAQLDPDALQPQLDLRQRRQQHNGEATAFNAEITHQREAIDRINTVKQDYDRQCSDRPYRRSDFASLSPAAQAAMRAGLDDIAVPYLDPARSN